MRLDSKAAAALLSVPVADRAVATRMRDLGPGEALDALDDWLEGASATGWLPVDSVMKDDVQNRLQVRLAAPFEGLLTFSVTDEIPDDLDALRGQIEAREGEVQILVSTNADADPAWLRELDSSMGAAGSNIVFVDACWSAALLIEKMRPILDAGSPLPGDGPGRGAYFEPLTGETESGLELGRSTSYQRKMTALLVEDRVSYEEKLESVKRDISVHDGTILFASVFLPPVTHAEAAVRRFYEQSFGIRPENLGLISERYRAEHEAFQEHISHYQRIDIIDRQVLCEYLRAPEYYQMPLTVEELRQQVDNVLELLSNDNYMLCLCPEAISLSFEIRGTEVRVRSDRRNKAQPRDGRVTSLRLDHPDTTEAFEREFWSYFRATEPDFKNKDLIAMWLVREAAAYAGPLASSEDL